MNVNDDDDDEYDNGVTGRCLFAVISDNVSRDNGAHVSSVKLRAIEVPDQVPLVRAPTSSDV